MNLEQSATVLSCHFSNDPLEEHHQTLLVRIETADIAKILTKEVSPNFRKFH